MPLTSNLSVHACPLASDSKAARVRCPRYLRVNIRAYASAIRVTRVCARVTSARSTHERISIASIPRPLPPRKKVEGLGTRLVCPLHVNLVHTFEREHVRFRVLACTRVSTHVCVCEYTRVRVRVLTCDSRATREGCQVARERHCIRDKFHIKLPLLSIASARVSTVPSVSPKAGYQGAPPPFPTLMWSLECLIYFEHMEKFYPPPPPPGLRYHSKSQLFTVLVPY